VEALIVVLPGDGVGPEVCRAAVSVLAAVAASNGHRFIIDEHAIGGAAIDLCGDPLPEHTLNACRRSDAVLLGAVGGPRWSDPARRIRPEHGLLRLRRAMGVFANLRPVVPQPRVAAVSPLKAEILQDVDICFVRELTGGIYFGAKERDGDRATDVCTYETTEIERVLRLAFRLARGRRGKVTSVDKANVLETSRLWRETAQRIGRDEYPDVQLEHALVDSAAMRLLQSPAAYDVIVTENMFGDILTDEAAVLAGSIGMLPSASLPESGPGLYEPIHGSAPDLAGRAVANPYGAILSVAMLLRHSLGLEPEADAIERAVSGTVARGVLTPDAVTRESRSAVVGTDDVAAAVVRAMGVESKDAAVA